MNEDESLMFGGLMRCCTETWREAMNEAREWHDGDVIQCKYATDDPLHRMIRIDDTWRWDH